MGAVVLFVFPVDSTGHAWLCAGVFPVQFNGWQEVKLTDGLTDKLDSEIVTMDYDGPSGVLLYFNLFHPCD